MTPIRVRGKNRVIKRCDGCEREYAAAIALRHCTYCGADVHTVPGQSPAHQPEHGCWRAMLNRCSNPKHSSYRNYGARGIRVCERWLNFENFYSDMGPRPSPTHSIDRINSLGNYEPGNCRWATKHEQNLNTSVVHLIEFQGRTNSLFGWSQEIGLHPKSLHCRLFKYGWTVEEALTVPSRDKRKAMRLAGIPANHIPAPPWRRERKRRAAASK